MESLPSNETAPEPSLPAPSSSLTASTLALHADDHLLSNPDIAPPLHVSTTFRYARDPDDLVPASERHHSVPTDTHVYSRHTAPNSTRLESLLAALLHAPCLTYSSGLAALHALYVFLRPQRVSVGPGYFGSRGVLGLHEKLYGMEVLPLECEAEALQQGDVIHLETPWNPTGEARNIAAFAAKAKARGAFLVVDATFGPPVLQDPFVWGADVVMHSGTKYLGGHSDLLMGVLAVKREGWLKGLAEERLFLGSVMGSLEGWLGVRSLRTLELRVRTQSASAEKLVAWLSDCVDGRGDQEDVRLVKGCVMKVQHASLQKDDMNWIKLQMPNGFGPVFAIWMNDENLARTLPANLSLFSHATSLGSVESLIEWRAMSDYSIDRRLMRVSVGLEGWVDLRDDFRAAFSKLNNQPDKE